MKLPILYGKSSTNKYKVWQIEIFDDCYKVTHGFENCKMTTQSRPVEEKNVGRANHTTKGEQAIKEAKAKWQKQIDNKGYREKKEDIGKNDFYHPMKAGYYDKNKDKIVFPCYAQPKLNGVKVIVPERKNSCIKYQTSGGKYYETLSHLDLCIENIFHDSLIPDGEIYKHGEELQDISSAVKKKNGLTPELEYWVYDFINDDEDFQKKLENINDISAHGNSVKVKACPTHEVNSHEEIVELFKYYVNLGYEGLIIRNKKSKYKFGPNRSQECLKFKDFKDAEFMIVDYDKDVHGRVIWWCETENGNRFKVIPKGSHAKRKKWYKNGKKYLRKMMTVRFLELSKDGIPQGNPVGHGDPKDVIGECIRDYE